MAELDLLGSGYGLELGEGDGMGGEVDDLDSLLGCPRGPVEKHTSASDGLLGFVWRPHVSIHSRQVKAARLILL